MNWFIPRLELAVWRDERGLSSADFGAVSRGKKVKYAVKPGHDVTWLGLADSG